MTNTEKSIGLLPLMGSIYEKIDIKGYMKKEAEKAKVENPDMGLKELAEKIGIDVLLDTVFVLVFKNIKLVKEEIFEIVAIIQDTEIEEVKKQSILKTLKVLKEILKDEEIKELFI